MEKIQLVLFSERNSQFGINFLKVLDHDPRMDVVGVVTRPEGHLCSYYADEPVFVDLGTEARNRGIPVLQPFNVNTAQTELLKLNSTYFIVANYQQILARPILSVPQRFAINFHPTPLPRYAGLNPFFWMAKFGEKQGGVSAIAIDEIIDGGDIIEQKLFPLTGRESERELQNIHFEASYELLRTILDQLDHLDPKRFRAQDFTKRTYFGAREFAEETSARERQGVSPVQYVTGSGVSFASRDQHT